MNPDQARSSRWLRLHLAPLAILALAFLVQLYGLGVRTFHGDELGSLVNANDLLHNLHALAYFLFLRLWMVNGSSEFMLRILSVFFTVTAVAVLYVAVKRLSSRRIALFAMVLFATSPFAEVYAQQVRFYSLFLLAACLSLLAFTEYLACSDGRRRVVLALGNVSVLLTHLMSTLLLTSEALTAFLLARLFDWRQKLLGLAVLGGGFALILVPPVREFGFNLLSTYVADPTRYSVARGLGIVQIAKIPLSFFFFTFGESVYPLTYWLVVPGGLLFGLVFLFGLRNLRADPRLFIFVIVTFSFSMVTLYVVLDSLIPNEYTGASPRYLIFLLPFFYLTVAMGLGEKRNALLLVPLVAVNLGSLGFFWNGDWAYTDDLLNWRSITEYVSGEYSPSTVVLIDGRANDTAAHYFPGAWDRQSMYQYQQSNDLSYLFRFSRIIVLTDDYRFSQRLPATLLLQKIASAYDRTSAYSQYPLFIYTYDRKRAGPSNTYRVDLVTGKVDLPAEYYGLQFQDVRLPIPLNIAGTSVASDGAFGLPRLDGSLTQTLALEPASIASSIWVMSNVLDASLAPGTPVATLRVVDMDGSTQAVPLRVGYETYAWNSQCPPAACLRAYTWRKRLALLGDAAYPDSWQEFDASIFATQVKLSRSALIRSLEIDRLPGPGSLYVWGIVLQP